MGWFHTTRLQTRTVSCEVKDPFILPQLTQPSDVSSYPQSRNYSYWHHVQPHFTSVISKALSESSLRQKLKCWNAHQSWILNTLKNQTVDSEKTLPWLTFVQKINLQIMYLFQFQNDIINKFKNLLNGTTGFAHPLVLESSFYDSVSVSAGIYLAQWLLIHWKSKNH